MIFRMPYAVFVHRPVSLFLHLSLLRAARALSLNSLLFFSLLEEYIIIIAVPFAHSYAYRSLNQMISTHILYKFIQSVCECVRVCV